MTKSEVEMLGHGLYRIYWKSGGYSLAAVGSDEAGNRWFAATNWTSGPSFDWTQVSRASLVESKEHRPRELKYDRD